MKAFCLSLLVFLFNFCLCRVADNSTTTTPSASFSNFTISSVPTPDVNSTSNFVSSSSSSSDTPIILSSSSSSPSPSPSPSPTPTPSPSLTPTPTSSSSTPPPSTTSPLTSLLTSSSTSSTGSSTSSSRQSSSLSADTLVLAETSGDGSSTSSADGSISTSTSSGDNSGNPPTTTFWDNRQAVVGTFVTVGLASLVFAALIAYKVCHRRQRRHERAMEGEERDFFDRGEPDTFSVHSSAPSITQMTTPTLIEASVSRDIHFGSNYTAYDLDYPPARPNPGTPTGSYAGVGAYARVHSQSLNSLTPYSSRAAKTFPTSPIGTASRVSINHRHAPGRDITAKHVSDEPYGGIYGQAF